MLDYIAQLRCKNDGVRLVYGHFVHWGLLSIRRSMGSQMSKENTKCVQSSWTAWRLKMFSRNDVRMFHSTLRKIPKKGQISFTPRWKPEITYKSRSFWININSLYIVGIYVSMKPQEYKILAKLEKQSRFPVKDTSFGKNDRGILVQFFADRRDIFLL